MQENNKYEYNTRKLAKSSAISLVIKIASLFLSMAASTLVLKVLGEYRYGVLASILSIVTWVYTFDLGIGTGLKNKLAASLGIKDYEAARNYISISYIFTSFIAIAFFIVILICSEFVDIASLLDIDNGGEDINLVLCVSFALVCVNFVASTVQNVIYATQRSEIVNIYAFLRQILYVACLYFAIKYSIDTLIFVAVAQGASQIVGNLVATVHVFAKEKVLRPNFSHVKWKYRNGLMTFGIQAFMVQIAAAVLNLTDNLVITKCIDASAVTPYNFCYKYFGIIIQFFTIVLTPFWMSYPMAYEKKDKSWMIKTVKRTSVITVLFSAGTLIAIILYKPFAFVWIGRALDYQKYLVFLTGMYIVIQMISTNFASLCMGTGNIKRLFIVNIFQAVANVPISVFLTVNCNMGVNGVITGSIIVMIVGAVVAIIQGIQIMREMK